MLGNCCQNKTTKRLQCLYFNTIFEAFSIETFSTVEWWNLTNLHKFWLARHLLYTNVPSEFCHLVFDIFRLGRKNLGRHRFSIVVQVILSFVVVPPQKFPQFPVPNNTNTANYLALFSTNENGLFFKMETSLFCPCTTHQYCQYTLNWFAFNCCDSILISIWFIVFVRRNWCGIGNW